MIRCVIVLFLALLILSPQAVFSVETKSPTTTIGSSMQAGSKTSNKLNYPKARQCDQVDDYHGVKVQDPYRWLEDPDSEETRAWVEQENKVTHGFLDAVAIKPAIRKRLEKIWNYEKHGIPFEEAGRLFFFKNTGLQNQDVLFVQDSPGAAPRVLLDPNKLSSDGTVALSGSAVSDDGKLLAYGLSKSGSDWQEWYVRNIDTGKDLDDHLRWVKFSDASWTKDNKGFFYSCYDKPDEKTMHQVANYYQKLYYHKVGNPQEKDELIYERKDQKEWGFGGSVTEDGKFLVIHVWQGTEPKNRIFYKSLEKAGGKVTELFPEPNAKYEFVGNDGAVFWFRTDLDAPRGRLIAVDTAASTKEKPAIKQLVAESQDTLEAASATGGRFFLHYLKDAFTLIKEVTTSGASLREVKLPGIGTASGFGGKMSDEVTYYSYTSFNTPSTIYKYDIESGGEQKFFQPKVAFSPDSFVTEQVFVESKDGTKVPLFITYKKGIAKDGTNPTYLYGYGGFDVAMRPQFSITAVAWMEMGGIYAQACLRGGSEYGQAWHEAGMKKNKQNVFDDFIACGEWLIANKYTSTPKLAIAGGSNGGLLVGACLTQRPDLFGAACAAVGVMDMLRFHKFTIGWGWVSDYGCSDNPDDFKVLYAYSPLHNLKKGTAYPPTLITTADHDDRVVPAHSFKFAAALQEAHGGDSPVVIRIDTKAGHGAGKPTAKLIDEWSDRMAFLVRVLDFEQRAQQHLASGEAPGKGG